MAYRINRPCIKWDCPSDAVDRGHCRKHAPPIFQGGRRAQRLPQDWANRRAFVMRRDKGICHLCGETGADGVDHIKAGDDHSFDNLAPVHHNVPPYCHRYKSAREGVEARKKIKKDFEEEKRKRRRRL